MWYLLITAIIFGILFIITPAPKFTVKRFGTKTFERDKGFKDIVSSATEHSKGYSDWLVKAVTGKSNYKPAEIQSFGNKRKTHIHKGVDVGLNLGDPIYAPFNGTVLRAYNYNDRAVASNGAGTYIVLKKENSSNVMVSMHHSRNLVKSGERVLKGQKIAEAGGSGFGVSNYYQVHAHLEYRLSDRGEAIDPMTVTENTGSASSVLSSIDKTSQVIKSKNNSISSKEKENYIINYLETHLNFTLEQSCGLIGNLLEESQLDEVAHNKTKPYGRYGAQGIAQWRASRVDSYKKYFNTENDIVTDANFQRQVEFIVYELKNFFQRNILNKLTKETSVVDACKLFLHIYEAPGNASKIEPIRCARSLEVYERHKRYDEVGYDTITQYSSAIKTNTTHSRIDSEKIYSRKV